MSSMRCYVRIRTSSFSPGADLERALVAALPTILSDELSGKSLLEDRQLLPGNVEIEWGCHDRHGYENIPPLSVSVFVEQIEWQFANSNAKAEKVATRIREIEGFQEFLDRNEHQARPFVWVMEVPSGVAYL
jgi:hypothetical protein